MKIKRWLESSRRATREGLGDGRRRERGGEEWVIGRVDAIKA
jgi:hypothetical protein